MLFRLTRKRALFTAALTGVLAFAIGAQRHGSAQVAENLTPGMLFGPLYLADGQHIELCASYLGEGGLKAMVHFRNLSTGEVTQNQELNLPGGGGECAAYRGTGHIVGLARGDGAASDWVSPSNALISTMAVVDDTTGTRVSVLGIPKIWVRGF